MWNRRLKIPLVGITQSQIDEILITQGVLETSVPGTGKDGGPNCATVKPVSYTHLRAHETVLDLVCRLLLEKKKKHTT